MRTVVRVLRSKLGENRVNSTYIFIERRIRIRESNAGDAEWVILSTVVLYWRHSMSKKLRTLEFIWKYRILLGLSAILVIQTPLILFKLAFLDQRFLETLVEVTHVVLTSGLAVYLFSKAFESFLRARLYQGVQKDWQEVRVVYSQSSPYRGTGEVFPREPTLLIQQPILDRVTPFGPLGGRSMGVSFNSAYEGRTLEGETTFLNGRWSELTLLSAKHGWVGFPSALYSAEKGPD